jgi:hypothetical protein
MTVLFDGIKIGMGGFDSQDKSRSIFTLSNYLVLMLDDKL